jgi:hypothetical protein
MASEEALPLNQLHPDRLYTIGELCRFIPGRRGKRISIDIVRRWVARGQLRATDLSTSAKYRDWRVRGADLLAYLAAKTTPGPAIVSPAELKAEARAKFQAYVDRISKPMFQHQHQCWFYPPDYAGPRPPTPKDIRDHQMKRARDAKRRKALSQS